MLEKYIKHVKTQVTRRLAGGLGMNVFDGCLIAEEFARGCSGINGFMVTNIAVSNLDIVTVDLQPLTCSQTVDMTHQ